MFLVDELILTPPPGRGADFPVRSNVQRQEGFRRLLEPWEGRGLLRTGKSALRWRCQDAPHDGTRSTFGFSNPNKARHPTGSVRIMIATATAGGGHLAAAAALEE